MLLEEPREFSVRVAFADVHKPHLGRERAVDDITDHGERRDSGTPDARPARAIAGAPRL